MCQRCINLLAILFFSLPLIAAESTEIKVKTDDVIDVGGEEDSSPTPMAPTGDVGVGASTETTLSSGTVVEKIQVTGSHIKRIDMEGPSPVTVLDREYLDQSGYNSVSDVLRDSAMSSFGAKREATEEVTSIGSATMGLRGFGADKVLVLMNGQRLPKIGGGSSVDLNLIPFQAVERIEILKDGASATYGSDALAGVINFITKKDFDGSVVSMRYSQPEQRGGARSDISATYGKNFSKGNILATYQYRSNRRVLDRDRSWSNLSNSPGNWSSYSYPANVRPKTKTGKYKAADGCPSDRLGSGGQCRFDYSQYTSSLPDLEQHSALLGGELKMGALNSYANLNYTRRQVQWQFAPSADDFKDNILVGGSDYSVGKAVAEKAGFANSDDIEFKYRTVNEFGPRARRDTTDAYGATVGTKGFFADSWEWDASVNYGFSELYNLGHAGFGNTKELFALMKKGVFKPGALGGKTGDVSSAAHRGEQWVRSNNTNVQFISSGELGQAAGGNLALAVGAASNWEGYEVEVDSVTGAGDLWGGIGENGQGSRNFQSIFSELVLNYEMLEIQVAGRFDNYSDFGSTVNPKFALRFKPSRSVMFRGSVGTGFKAPSLDQLYSSRSYSYPWFEDTQACAEFKGSEQEAFFCEEQQYRVFSGGNKELKEETSFSYNIGTVLQPTRDFSVSIDYWETRIENAVGLNFSDLMVAESILGNNGVRSQGVQINRTNGASGEITDIFAPNLNLAKQESEGLDISASYIVKMGPWTLRPQMDHTHLIKNEEEIFPGLGLRSKLDEWGKPRWRNTAFITTGFHNHSFRIGARTIAGQYKVAHLTNPADKSRLPIYTEYDLHYEFAGKWGGTLALGAKNALGSDRPTDLRASFDKRINSALYDQIGRLYYLGYSQTF